MPDQDFYASFLVRLWRTDQGSCNTHDEQILFEIEHIQSGKIRIVETFEEFLALITSYVNQIILPDMHD